MDEDQEIEVDHPFDGPLPHAREVALPKRLGMPLEELGPGIRVGVRIGTEALSQQDVLDRLSRNVVPEPFHRLANFGVSPSRLFSDPDDQLRYPFARLGPARFLGRLVGFGLGLPCAPSSISRTHLRNVE